MTAGRPRQAAGAVLPLALTMGEPAGIGGEIALAAWLRRNGSDAQTESPEPLPPFLLIDDADRLAALAEQLGWTVPLHRLPEDFTAGQVCSHFRTALPVLHRPLPGSPAVPGQPQAAHGAAVVAAIDTAVALTCAGRTAAVVTNPIHKKSLYDIGFAFPGHTEYLAKLAGDVPVVMLLASPLLKVVPITIHLPLRQAVDSLTTELIVTAGRITAAALRRDFGLARPRLAFTGLNPHAGEEGGLGQEDQTIIAPAIALLQAEGIHAVGPLAADTLFHARARAGYDVALCMYHDQALIPIKTLDFDGGVNVTLGLPFIRTSPDHGTAFGLAGQGVAKPDSLMAALRLAASMAAARAPTGADLYQRV